MAGIADAVERVRSMWQPGIPLVIVFGLQTVLTCPQLLGQRVLTRLRIIVASAKDSHVSRFVSVN